MSRIAAALRFRLPIWKSCSAHGRGDSAEPGTPVVAAAVSGTDMDKPWLEVDTNANSPRKNSLYVSMTQFYSNNNISEIGVSH